MYKSKAIFAKYTDISKLYLLKDCFFVVKL